MKVYLENYGCKVNSYETESMTADFRLCGYDVINDPLKADVIVINSCTVTASGDSKSLYAVRKYRKSNPDAVIVLTGCLPQASPEISEKIIQADIVTGTRQRGKIPDLVKDFMEKRQRLVNIPEYGKADEYEKITCGSFENRTRAFIKIQDGCNQFCTYCLIPYARGRCRSKPLEDLREEVKAVVQSGIKEIVLVGINLMFYGKEFGLRLIDAVEACCEIEGVDRVRLGSLEPEMISDEDLHRLSVLKQFCPQFHLSLQSGCDRTLRAMNRHYNTEEYLMLTEKIRQVFPECSITTDVMVGFPDERDEDFEQSLEFVRKIGFAKIHVFQYSKRSGTAAESFDNHISKDKKQNRADRMKAAGDEAQRIYLEKQVGKTVSVLFEREISPDFHQGHAKDYTLIKIPEKNFKKSLRRKLFCVKIEESDNNCCIGKIIQ